MWLVDSLSNKMCVESSCGGGDTNMKDEFLEKVVKAAIEELSMVEKWELVIIIARGALSDIKKAEKTEAE